MGERADTDARNERKRQRAHALVDDFFEGFAQGGVWGKFGLEIAVEDSVVQHVRKIVNQVYR